MHLHRSPLSRSLVLVALLLSSCAVLAGPHRVPFNEAEFAAYRGPGTSTIAGQVIVTTSDGETHLGDGMHVTLLPVTSYTKEMVDREIGNGENLSASDPRLHQYTRLLKTDGQGKFVFDHIPAGEYFVTGMAEWSVGDQDDYQWACERVTVGKGQTLQIKVSKNLQRPGAPTLVIWAFE